MPQFSPGTTSHPKLSSPPSTTSVGKPRGGGGVFGSLSRRQGGGSTKSLGQPTIPTNVVEARLSDEIKELIRAVLPLPLLELGYCYYYGWGVSKNKGLALKYLYVAALLGDKEAQEHLAFMFENGRGVKRDMKLASKFYRMHAKGGHEDPWGMSWIYDDKVATLPLESREEAFNLAVTKLKEIP